MNIYVGNLPYSVSDDDLRDAFGRYGEVRSARVIMDKVQNRSKGFGFVEMSDDDAAQTAIDQLNGTDLKGRNLKVNEARPREDQRPGGRGDYRSR